MLAFKRWSYRLLAAVLCAVLLPLYLSQTVSALNLTSTSSSSTILNNYAGVHNLIDSPPSPVIAVNSQRVVQLVNNQFSIALRNGSLIAGGSVHSLTHTKASIGTSDPQVMWDPSSDRFYYSYLENNTSLSPSREGISWGFSKTADPNSGADFCSYFDSFNYGNAAFPDRQSLGDTANFLMWTSLRFSTGGAPLAAEANWVSKPPAGTTCPKPGVFIPGSHYLYNASSSGYSVQQPMAFPDYPVMSKQVDPDPTGWIVGLPSYVSANYLTLIQVSKGSNDQPVFGSPRNVSVPSYECPSNVPQGGETINSTAPINLEANISLDGMYMAFDPSLGYETLWTTDTIGANVNAGQPVTCNSIFNNGAAVRWYQINPAESNLAQVGTISSSSLGYFDSAIAPDRAVEGNLAKFGSDMVITFDSSSSSTDPAIWYEAKQGNLPATAPTLIAQSTGPYDDFSCYEGSTLSSDVCRFGDWPGAAPDPIAVTRQFGQDWITNEWNAPQTSTQEYPVWRTQIAEIGFN